jgi:histidinol-phosphate/aromatic aminotransferase/cobyric acid decarboxylase-like protein
MHWLASIALLATVPVSLETLTEQQSEKIVAALNAHTDCLTSQAILLGKGSSEKADALVHAARSKCTESYEAAAKAYAAARIDDVPSSAREAAEAKATQNVTRMMAQ